MDWNVDLSLELYFSNAVVLELVILFKSVTDVGLHLHQQSGIHLHPVLSPLQC